jgi:hypothetical protein
MFAIVSDSASIAYYQIENIGDAQIDAMKAGLT